MKKIIALSFFLITLIFFNCTMNKSDNSFDEKDQLSAVNDKNLNKSLIIEDINSDHKYIILNKNDFNNGKIRNRKNRNVHPKNKIYKTKRVFTQNEIEYLKKKEALKRQNLPKDEFNRIISAEKSRFIKEKEIILKKR